MSIGQFGTLGFQNRESITAEYIYVVNKGGIFVYNGSAALGNLVASVTTQTSDKYGNHTIPFALASYGGSFACALSGGGLVWFNGSLLIGWTAYIEFEVVTTTALSLFAAATANMLQFTVGNTSAVIKYVFPSGDATGVTDWNTWTGALAIPNCVIYPAPGIYYINQPLLIPAWSAILGSSNVLDNSTLSDNGVTLIVVAGFTNPAALPDPGAIYMQGGPSLPAGQNLAGLNVDCSSAPAGIHGIVLYNAVYGTAMSKMCVQSAPGTGLFAAFSTSQVDGLHVDHSLFARCGRGIDLNIADGVFEDVNATGSLTDHNWFIRNAVDSIFSNCRGGNAPIHNWYFAVNQTTVGGYCLLEGCGSDLAGSYGMLIDYGNTGGILLNILGFSSDQDNAGATTGAIRISSAPQPVLFDGLTINTTADFGVQYANAANLDIASAIITAGTAAFDNAGGNGKVHINWDAILDSNGANEWGYVGAVGQPAFGAGWSNVGGGNVNAAFKLRSGNYVDVKGYVVNSIAANAAAVFTLPTGCQPVSQQIFPCVENGAVYGNGLVVQTNGEVKLFNNAGAGDYSIDCSVSLDV